MSWQRRLRSTYVRIITSDHYGIARRMLAEIRRMLTFKRHVVHVFLQLDDPYSYLLSHYLRHFRERYEKVELKLYLCQALRAEYMPQPAMLAEYAVRDCRQLAKEFGVPFLDKGEAPAVEFRRSLLDFLAQEHEEDDFNELFTQALAAYWRGDTEGVQRMLGHTGTGSAETDILIGRNQLLLRKRGHYNCATMLYGGEWYWGVDRLHYLTGRLEALGLVRDEEEGGELATLQQARQLKLPATLPGSAATLPPLEMFYSFRSPYSYLALKSAFRIADAFGLKLAIRPVLPMVMRGLAVPKNKLVYIVKDAAREAKRLGIPFGKFEDPVGKGVERCMAAFYYAREQKRERDFVKAAGIAIFGKGIDVAQDEGMQVVAERAKLFWPDVKAVLADDAWRGDVEENREVLTEAGLWGVPVFRIGDRTFWGQDRDWLLARRIEDLCHGGDGIMV